MSFDAEKMRDNLLTQSKKLQKLQSEYCPQENMVVCNQLISSLVTDASSVLDVLIMMNEQIASAKEMPYDLDIDEITGLHNDAQDVFETNKDVSVEAANLIKLFPEKKQHKVKSITEGIKYLRYNWVEQLKKAQENLDGLVSTARPSFGV